MLALNFKYLLENRETPSYTKDAIRTLQKTGSLVVGNWIKTIATSDLISAIDSSDLFLDRAENPTAESVERDILADNFVILTEVLCVGEGIDLTSDNKSLLFRLSRLKLFLTMEYMVRAVSSSINLKYSSMTLGEEALEENLVVAPAGASDKIKTVVSKINQTAKLVGSPRSRPASKRAPVPPAEPTEVDLSHLSGWMKDKGL